MIPVAAGFDCVCGHPMITLPGRPGARCAVCDRRTVPRPARAPQPAPAGRSDNTFGMFYDLVVELDAMTYERGPRSPDRRGKLRVVS